MVGDICDWLPQSDGDTCTAGQLSSAFPAQYQCVHSICLGGSGAVTAAANGDEGSVSVLLLETDSQLSRAVAATCQLSLVLLDASSLKPVLTLSDHTDRITDLRFVCDRGTTVLTSSLDGYLRHFDLRSGDCVLKHCDESGGGERKRLTCADVSSDGRLLCAGTELLDEDVFLVFWDARAATSSGAALPPLGGYWLSHSDDITSVRFDQRRSGFLCSSSVDGLVNIYDCNRSTEQDALQTTFNCCETAATLTWFDFDGVRHLAAVTHTDDVYVWNVENDEQVSCTSRQDICSLIKRKVPAFCRVPGCHSNGADGLLVLGASETDDRSVCARTLALRRADSSLALSGHARLSPPDHERLAPPLRCSSLHQLSGALLVGGQQGGCVQLWRRREGGT